VINPVLSNSIQFRGFSYEGSFSEEQDSYEKEIRKKIKSAKIDGDFLIKACEDKVSVDLYELKKDEWFTSRYYIGNYDSNNSFKIKDLTPKVKSEEEIRKEKEIEETFGAIITPLFLLVGLVYIFQTPLKKGANEVFTKYPEIKEYIHKADSTICRGLRNFVIKHL